MSSSSTVVFVVVGLHSPPEQQDDFAAFVVPALSVKSRQSGGHEGEQPGGQVGSRQQSTAPATAREFDHASPAHTLPAVSISSAATLISSIVRFVIG
jgi:hypothetical protein